MRNLIGRVRLGLIEVRDLNAVVRKDGLVDANDLMDALLYHTGTPGTLDTPLLPLVVLHLRH